MLSEFKAFVMRGNVLDLAVGVIIGAGFGKIVTSLTDDVIMPVISAVTGGIDFSNKFIVLGDAAGKDVSTLAKAKEAGIAVLGYGSFITAIINFLILAFVIFLIVRQANKMMAPPAEAPAGPSEVDLLTEIRDALKK
ncbi:MAG TPA: large conductance mechanosensitive channel protein MscL [Chakrabartia sp.]|jgi:large conductance mechanosensitive channel|nr:large conductance mechanosensitive channel protein MscL [Chakrabartia sp.]